MKHLTENNETYLSHLRFAANMSLQLSLRAFMFMFHALFPFIDVPGSLNLKSTCRLITEWYEYSETRKEK